MDERKYCRNCGKPNPPDAAYCANCGAAFVSAAASPQSRTIFGLSRNMMAAGLVVVVLLLTLGCVALTATTTTTSPTATPAVTATPVVKATAAPKATTPTATPTATDTSAAEVKTVIADMEAQGYTVTKPFTLKGVTNGEPSYSGTLYKNGYYEDTTMIKASSSSAALDDLHIYVASAQALGTIGSYDSSTHWSGVGTASDEVYAYNAFTSGNWMISMVTRQ